jgi:hypothetical protein
MIEVKNFSRSYLTRRVSPKRYEKRYEPANLHCVSSLFRRSMPNPPEAKAGDFAQGGGQGELEPGDVMKFLVMFVL